MDQFTLPLPGGVDETVPMEVANIGFMLERLGRDCDDLQFIRELTQNSLEAGATQVVWDVDWATHDLTGVYKLSCIDNGVGMTPEELRTYINKLSSSTHEQAFDGNYGVGAKVAAATRNPAGLVYQSWKHGQGALIQLWRDPVTEQYGLRQFPWANGRYDYWVPIMSEARPEQIDDQGTKVILFGCDEDHNTIEPPDGVPTPSRWITRYLNARYFRFPDGVEVKAREGWTADRGVEKRNLLRSVRGQGRFLAEHSIDSGTVALSEATMHWWILANTDKRRNASDLVNTGHVATLWQDELYEMRTGRSGVTRLHQFGIIFGYQDVVLYVEPRNGAARPITSNTARTQLLLYGRPLPYADWAAEFRALMPQGLQDYMDSVIAGATDQDHHHAISERLKHYQKLFRLSRYRVKPDGRLLLAEPVLPRRKPATESADPADNDTSTTGRSRKQERTGRLLAAMLADEGTPGESNPPSQQDLPVVKWVSLANGLRTPDILDDRAAKYLPEADMIHANADFRVFTDMISYWCEQYGVDSGNDVVADVVKEWFEQALVETVIGCQALQGEKRWPVHDIERALSEEALTAAVMQRYHIANSVKRTLGAKLGSLKEKASASA